MFALRCGSNGIVDYVAVVAFHHVDLFPTFAAIASPPLGIQPSQALHGIDPSSLYQSPSEGIAEHNLYSYLSGDYVFHQLRVLVQGSR